VVFSIKRAAFPLVNKDEDELPEKVEKKPTEEELEMGLFTPEYRYMDYPEGTVLTKPNPQSAADFLANLILRKRIVPTLIESLGSQKRRESEIRLKNELSVAESLIVNASEIKIEE
jgi:hypothetical protein